MFGSKAVTPLHDLFNMQREFDRLFNQFWNDLPTRHAALASTASVQVKATDDGWRLEIPMPGIDPEHVRLETAGNSISIRTEEQSGERAGGNTARHEQTLSLPAFLDVERIQASYRHGMLQLTLPLKDSVKPRRIQIDTTGEQKQLATATA